MKTRRNRLKRHRRSARKLLQKYPAFLYCWVIRHKYPVEWGNVLKSFPQLATLP